jgi:RNA polymerase sigma-70 factor (ECF subfamily)
MNEHPTQRDWVRQAMDTYEAPLVRYAARHTGNLDLARDIVQDTFLRLCSAEPEQIGDYLAPWLYRVCRNRALDVMKKERRMQPLAEGQAERQASPTRNPRAEAADAETGGLLRTAMAALPDKQQEVFRLKFQDQLSYQEISDVTGFPLNNVRYLIHTALKALREQLRGQLDLAGGVH